MQGDILIDFDTNDVVAVNGDFAVGDATVQNQKLLLVCNKNDFKTSPMVCVGAFNYLDDEGNGDLIRDTRKEYVKDGMSVNSIALVAGQIKVDASYPS